MVGLPDLRRLHGGGGERHVIAHVGSLSFKSTARLQPPFTLHGPRAASGSAKALSRSRLALGKIVQGISVVSLEREFWAYYIITPKMYTIWRTRFSLKLVKKEQL